MKNGMRPIHPGEILLEDFCMPIGMTPHALSKALHVPPARVNDVMLQRCSVTLDTAFRLAQFFGGDAQSWLNLQIAYDRKLAEKAAMKAIVKEIMPLPATDDVCLTALLNLTKPSNEPHDSLPATSAAELPIRGT